MAIYLKQFETQAAYEAAQSGLILPNVSLTLDNNTVHYNPYVPPETRVVAKYNVTDTSNPTKIADRTNNNISSIEIDGVEQPSVVSAYTFDTIGEHTIKYTLTNPTTIGWGGFNGCSGMTSIVIPDSVTSIGGEVFNNCKSLTSVTMPDSITSIGNSAFNYCGALTSISIPRSVITIGDYAFSSCYRLTSIGPVGSGASVEIPSGVTQISSLVFSYCYALTSVTIPNSVTSIGQMAFTYCDNITSVTIPDSVTSISYGAFQDCSRLRSITVNATTPPTLSSSAFSNTNNCPIYVPSGSVDTYKAASGWSDYSSRIQAIP